MDHLIKCRCHLIRKVGSLMLGSGHYCAIPVSPDSLGTIYSGTYNGKLLTSWCSRPLEISRPGQITSAILPFSVRLLGTLINIERTEKRELSAGISSLCWEVLLWSCLGHGIMVQKYHNHLPVAGGIIFTGIFHFWFPSSSCVCADKSELSEPPVTAEGKKNTYLTTVSSSRIFCAWCLRSNPCLWHSVISKGLMKFFKKESQTLLI